MSSGNPEFGRD
ncbi:hypothetical protein A2U01_0029913, partial [Trifolium medium]|nr:hypothetical protein [Trifolium medium]